MTAAIRAFALRILGSRRLPPETAGMQSVSFRAGIVHLPNWATPLAAAAALIFLVWSNKSATVTLPTAISIAYIVAILEIGVCGFAFVSGRNLVRTWSARRSTLHEMVVTPIRPAQIYQYLSAGQLGPWVFTIVAAAFGSFSALSAHYFSPAVVARMPVSDGVRLAHVLALLPLSLLIGLSLVESVRVVHALLAPDILAPSNIAMTAGRVVPGIARNIFGFLAAGFVATVAAGTIPAILAAWQVPKFVPLREFVWFIAWTFAMLVVIEMKRRFAAKLVRDFAARIHLARWIGAAELEIVTKSKHSERGLAELLASWDEIEEALEAPGYPHGRIGVLLGRYDLLARKWSPHMKVNNRPMLVRRPHSRMGVGPLTPDIMGIPPK